MNHNLRMNVRNFLVGLTPEEVYREWRVAVEMGEKERARYCREFLLEEMVESEEQK